MKKARFELPHKAAVMAAIALCLVFSLLHSAESPAQGPPSKPQGGPYTHKVCSASSVDGLTWTRDEGCRLEHASVPCAIAVDDKVYLYFVNADTGPGKFENVACATSTDGLNFKKEDFAIEGLPSQKAVDPSIIRDADGRFRLYYFASAGMGDPAVAKGKHEIHVAFSDDGIRFKEAGTAFSRGALVDPDVFRFKGTWFMYVFGEGSTVIATSDDGMKFTYKQELGLRGYGTVAPIALDEGRLRLYAFDQTKPAGNSVCSFLSTDGINWEKEAGLRLTANEDEQITDPFVIRWNGGYKMYFKIDPRGKSSQVPGDRRPGKSGKGDGEPGGVPAPQQPVGPGQVRLPGPDEPGPWDRDVLCYRVTPDGAVEKVVTFDRAGVPTIARLKDVRLVVAHQHFPENNVDEFDKVAVRFSEDDGKTWSKPEVIKLAGLPEGMRFPFDPTLVPLPDGGVRLYFTSVRGRTFQESTPAIYSAISKDGVSYVVEEGMRFGVEGQMVIDCAAVLHNGKFHLFVPNNGPAGGPGGQPGGTPGGQPKDRASEGLGYHAVSDDGLKFTRVDDVRIEGNRKWLGNAQSDGKTITFYGTGEGLVVGGSGLEPGSGERAPRDRQPRGSLWMATSEDGARWQLVESPSIGGGDPGAVTARDGGLVVVITGEPRLGTPSAKQRR
ncbi:MAG: hypothetical protein RDV41_03245 [Planctomycetota bacterium]|nr:hypothetical protein [Planctomycetota bacterium]